VKNLQEPEIKSVLVVDDDHLVRSFMDDLLRQEGYDVMTVPDGLAALDMIKTRTPHAIFLDLFMPGIGGKSLCRVIRKMESFKDVYIVILSAALAEEPISMTELGANACIAKGPLAEMGQNVLLALREPDAASSRCSSGGIIGIESIYPRKMTLELLFLKNNFDRTMTKISQGVMELTPDGRILSANPAALALISIPEEQLLASPFPDLFEGDDRSRIDVLLNPSNGQDGSIPYETPVTLNGRLLSLETVPEMEGQSALTVFMTDVTWHKREEASLREKGSRLEKVLSNNSDAMIVADKEGMILFVNPAAEAIFGLESSTLVGTYFGFPLVGDDTAELDVINRSGEARNVEMRVVETEWNGEPAHLASIRDITERNKMTEALGEANRKILEHQEKLVEEERLKVMLQMAGATAHELNQPLSGLLGNVELLEMSSDDPKMFSECLRDIKSSGRRIADTVKKIQNIRYYETKPYAKNGVIIDIDQDVHILSIEDSDAYFETIRAVFQGMNRIHLSRAKTIAEAISRLTDGDIDLILLDYELPDGNGFDFMEMTRENGIETPVVILTGTGDEMIASRLIREGVFDYLTKAVFNAESISRCISNIFEKTRLKNEIAVAQDRMGEMAVRDVLTGLHNRRYLFEALEREKARAKRYGNDLAVCMIDLDHFKRINDTFGHTAGDVVLSEIGKLLLQWARETDLPCRYGGEEFAVILPETSLEGARVACERLRRMVAEHRFEHEGAPAIKVTISIGLAHYDKEVEQTVSDLINKADAALYRAKKEGRNRVSVNL
jgi:two-component system, cell cycle response regulator